MSTQAKSAAKTPHEAEERSDRRPVILSVAFPYAPVGACAIGGAEVILSGIESALPRLGFRSVVVAHAASKPHGRLYPTIVPEGEITQDVRAATEKSQQKQIDRALAENPIALVHMHGLDFHRYRIPAHLPVLVTLHLPPAWYPEAIWSLPANYQLLCVSEAEKAACPERARDRILVVANGVPLPDASTLRTEGRYALMLSRICAEKNIHTALDAARLAGMPAMVAGEVFPYGAHQRYFTEEIQPRLTRSGQNHTARAQLAAVQAEARFLGPVTGAAKARLLARAACLLLPSLAPETSSLVAMEALAAGVPVIAMASGAVPEILEDGRTGLLIAAVPGTGPEAVRALAEAIGRLPLLNRGTCRSVAEQRFSLDPMLESYGELYRRFALKSPPPPVAGEIPSSAQDLQPAPAAPSSSVEVLTSEEALDALVPEWTELWIQDPNATPFQHPAWLRPWWRQFGPDGQLHAFALRNKNEHRLRGFLPTYIYHQPITGERQLFLLGAGTSDYLDGIWSANPSHLADQALHYLLSGPGNWDIATLHQLRAGTPLLFAGREHEIPVGASEPCSIIDTGSHLPPKVRANVGRYRRRAQATGSLQCSVARTAEEALDSFEHLVRLHRERWEQRGEAGVLTDARVLAHHREAVPSLLAAGLLRLFRLTLNSAVIGSLYALADAPNRTHRSLYLYLIGFDTRFADLSPGTLLLHEVCRYAREHGFPRLDLLRGGENYKQLWGAESKPTYALHFASPSQGQREADPSASTPAALRDDKRNQRW